MWAIVSLARILAYGSCKKKKKTLLLHNPFLLYQPWGHVENRLMPSQQVYNSQCPHKCCTTRSGSKSIRSRRFRAFWCEFERRGSLVVLRRPDMRPWQEPWNLQPGLGPAVNVSRCPDLACSWQALETRAWTLPRNPQHNHSHALCPLFGFFEKMPLYTNSPLSKLMVGAIAY